MAAFFVNIPPNILPIRWNTATISQQEAKIKNLQKALVRSQKQISAIQNQLVGYKYQLAECEELRNIFKKKLMECKEELWKCWDC